jgi:integrase/recombinase XerD
MSRQLAVYPSVPSAAAEAPAQASSDREMVALWLGTFRSKHTRDAYCRDARAFLDFAAVPLHAVTVRVIQAYAGTLEHFAPATQARKLSAVKSLIALAHRLGYLLFDVGTPIQLPAVKDRLSERILSEWQVQRLLESVRDARDSAMLRLIYSAGLRVSEAVTLCWRDLAERGDAGQITVLGKGGKTRVVLLPAPIWARLIPLRGNAGPDRAVFRSRQGGSLTRSQVHRIVKSAAKRAKLPPAVSVHFLRHAHVSHALDRGAPVHVVRATVGHASLETTTRYSHARPDDSSSRYLKA